MGVMVMGLGPMGRGVARNLALAGVPTRVWNRSTGPRKHLEDVPVTFAESPADAAGSTVLSLLPDVDQFRSVTGPEPWSEWSRRGVQRVVIMSTTSPQKIRDLDEDLSAYGISVSDAPMSGGEMGAALGTLSVMVGSQEAEWPMLKRILNPVASTVRRFGESGAGSVAKLCNQVVIAGTLTAVAEALALAEKANIDEDAFCDVLSKGLGSSAVLDAKRERMISRDYVPSGSAVNQLKDLSYVKELAADVRASIPLSSMLRELFEAVVAQGRGDEDHSVVLEQFRGDGARLREK